MTDLSNTYIPIPPEYPVLPIGNLNDLTTVDKTTIVNAIDEINATVMGVLNYVSLEVPSGIINGSNTAFIIVNVIVTGTEMVFLNGLLQYRTTDYTIAAGTTIIFVLPPLTGDHVLITYFKV